MDDELQPSSRKTAKSKKAPAVRHGKLNRRNAWSLPLRAVLTVLVVGVLSVTSVVAYAAIDLASSLKPGVTLGNEDLLNGVSIGELKGGVNMLLVGVDKRPADGYFGDPRIDSGINNDVTMLLHISQDHQSATVVSFPRDMLVAVPSCTDSDGDATSPMSAVKINSTYNEGGLACVVKTVEKLTGINIPFAAEIEFYGVVGLSNALGGVNVCVANQIQDTYTGTYLDPGEHSLQGMPALEFLRTRHGVGDGSDLDRISNQQVFLSALARKLTSEGTLYNPATVYALAKSAMSNMQLSESLHDIGRLISLGMTLRGIPLSNIVFLQYPNQYVNGGGAVIPEPTGAAAVNAALQNDEHVQLTGSQAGGAVVDANQTAAQKAADAAASATATATTAPVDSSGTATLPSSVLGTTADTVTCSKGRTLADQ